MSESRRQSYKQPPWDQELEVEDRSFGSWLRRQREMREIALQQIADMSKISSRYLEALEQERFDLLPAPVFAKGFLREYAKFVGLDPDEVVNYYLAARQAEEPEAPPPTPVGMQSAAHWTYGLVLTLGVVLLLGVVAGLSFYAERREQRPRQPPPMAAPPIFPQPALASPAGESDVGIPLRVTLDFTQNCWVEALMDDDERISEYRVQGESVALRARQNISLTLGNAKGVSMEVNGHPCDLMAKDGESLRIDLETAKACEGSQR